MTRLIRYVTHADLADALALGWLPCASLDGTHHGVYSAGFVEWICDCRAPWLCPERHA